MSKTEKKSGASGAGSGEGPGSDLGLAVLQAIRRIMRAVELHSKRLASQYNITSPQLLCLIAVGESGPLSVGELAVKIHLSSSTVIGILDRLEFKGLIHRMRDIHDRRKVFVSISEEGVRLLKEAPHPLQDRLSEAFTKLDAGEQERIFASLTQVVELMEAGGIEAAPILETGPLIKEPAGRRGQAGVKKEAGDDSLRNKG